MTALQPSPDVPSYGAGRAPQYGAPVDRPDGLGYGVVKRRLVPVIDGHMPEPAALPWIDEVREAVRRYVQARSRRADLADDIAQETVLRLVEYAAREPIRHPFALAIRIADSQMAEEGRRARRVDADRDLSLLAAPEPGPDAAAESRALVRRLQAALDTMPPLRRDVFLRRRLHRQSHEAIGQALGLTTAAVEKHITRAMIDLRPLAAQLSGDA